MGVSWPAEWTDPFIDEITLTINSIDAMREDEDLMLIGGGDVTLVGDLFSWAAPIYLYSTRTGNYATIAIGSVTVLDGHSIYFTPVSRPMPTAAVSLLSAVSIPAAAIRIGVRKGATVVLRDRGAGEISPTLDDAYNNDGGAATIDVDAGDINWDVTGAYSFIVDLTAATGDVDGFIVQNTMPPNGQSTLFQVIKNSTNDEVDLWARVGDATVRSKNDMLLEADADMTLDARGVSKTLNDASNTTFTGLISAETSIFGALNTLAGGVTSLTLDDAYNNDGGAATIDVDAGDVNWDVTGAYSFIVDLTAATGDVDGFIVQNVDPPNGQSTMFRVLKNSTNDEVDLWAKVGDATVESLNDMSLKAAVDITLDARGVSKTLNDASNTTFTGSISAQTSIFGALNTLAGGVTSLTLDDAYNNDGGAATIDVDAGDVNWDVTGAYSFIIDLTAATGDVDGFIVQNTVSPNGQSTIFRVLKNSTNDELDLWAKVGDATVESLNDMSLKAAVDITLDARGVSKTLNDASNTTFTGSISAQTSIFGALNTLAGGVTSLTLDDAYNNDGGAATIDVDAGDVNWDVTGAYSFIIDLTAATGDVDGFIVQNTVSPNGQSTLFKVLKNSTNDEVDLWAKVGDATVESLNDMSLKAAVDITLDARGVSKTLNDASNTTFTGSISAQTSIFGALNTLAGGAAGEVNTASNAGSTGVGPFDNKNGVDLEFRNTKSANNILTVTLDGSNKDVLHTIVEGNIDHDALDNYVANKHIDWTISQDPPVIHTDNYEHGGYTYGIIATAAAMQAISSPSDGESCFCTELGSPFHWQGNTWQTDKSIEVVNNSGYTVSEGDVVVPSTSTANSVTMTTSSNYKFVAGTVLLGGTNGSYITVAIGGFWLVYVLNACSPGHMLVTSTTLGAANSVGVTNQAGSFACCFGSKSSSPGYVLALVGIPSELL
ncbi:MAG: hypothetical protein GY841_15465 [FCB group bacterium]|nr:hypothetical protein [FCB group bacterium]